ncbi:nuclear transport factor 2 family protein [Microbulbifer sp. CAU 1566]|uniref:nuclear transport factor 2 family protein n=1 Tax=Microbulbifer sp. CAU 1566 TaxID=2933269 RepID=UPI002004C2E5|nr:nuclear transport factor 2 family protein [Microbulbifer sp. CAU 1566]MCK7597027.1 nuclear transport factor 2 family protein [Microbulbifer sp. CAU 1566]
MAQLIERLEHLYSDFMLAEPQAITSVYAPQVRFKDPVHEVHGLAAMQAYFAQVSQNLEECRFHFDTVLTEDNKACLWWHMVFRHPRLRGGKQLTLRGSSLLHMDLKTDRIIFHEDCYDLGAMIYEQVPLLGSVIRHIKRGLANTDIDGVENGVPHGSGS